MLTECKLSLPWNSGNNNPFQVPWSHLEPRLVPAFLCSQVLRDLESWTLRVAGRREHTRPWPKPGLLISTAIRSGEKQCLPERLSTVVKKDGRTELKLCKATGSLCTWWFVLNAFWSNLCDLDMDASTVLMGPWRRSWLISHCLFSCEWISAKYIPPYYLILP